MGTSVQILIDIEMLLLSFQSINYLSRYQDKSRLRFLVLILVFLQFNIVRSTLPNESYPINMFFQIMIVCLSGIGLAIYYYRYIVIELQNKNNQILQP